MRSEMMLDIGQGTRGFITGGLQHLTVELLLGRCSDEYRYRTPVMRLIATYLPESYRGELETKWFMASRGRHQMF